MIEKLRASLIGGKESDRSWVGIKLQSTVQPDRVLDFNATWQNIHEQCCRFSGIERTQSQDGV